MKTQQETYNRPTFDYNKFGDLEFEKNTGFGVYTILNGEYNGKELTDTQIEDLHQECNEELLYDLFIR